MDAYHPYNFPHRCVCARVRSTGHLYYIHAALHYVSLAATTVRDVAHRAYVDISAR